MSADDEPQEQQRARLVFVEFDGWIQETGELFDTTHEDTARERNIFDDKAVYEPVPLLVGRERLFEGLDESMIAAEVGKEYEVVLPSEKAAGPRDPKLVELFPIREFLKKDIKPEVGLQVNVKNKTGHISAVTAGRVRVDFNNRLAGRTLKYNFKIVSEPQTSEEKLNAILKMDYGSFEGFTAEFDDRGVRIKLPDVCKYDQKWLLAKYRIVSDLRDILEVDVVQFIEEYAKAETKQPSIDDGSGEHAGDGIEEVDEEEVVKLE